MIMNKKDIFFSLTCNDGGLAANAGVGRQMSAAAAAAATHAPVLVVLHVLHVAARPHEVGAGRPRGRRRGRARVVQGIPRVSGSVWRAPTCLGSEELSLATEERVTFLM